MLIICAILVLMLVLTAPNAILYRIVHSVMLATKLLSAQHVSQATMSLPTIPLHVLFAQTLWLTVPNAPLVLNARRAARGTQD